MSEISVTLTGNIATVPASRSTKTGDAMITFRLASNARRFDAAGGRFVDGVTSFVDVVAFRSLARNAAESVKRGDPVIVHGRLKVEEWKTDTASGTNVEVTAQHIGHDLGLCRTTVDRQRAPMSSGAANTSPTAALADLDATAAATDDYEVVAS